MDRWVMSPGRGSHFGRSCLRYSKLSISQVEGWIGVSAEELGYKKVCYDSWPEKQWVQCAGIPGGQDPRVEVAMLLEARPSRIWDSGGSG